jgi:hypothetical protein
LPHNGWNVLINQVIIGWIRSRNSQDPNSFGYYVREIENIRNMARAMGPLNFIACGEGFKVYVEEEDIILRCAYFITEREIHIVDVIQ